ncbi:succinyl-diaminopimelate desuccinylase [Aliikangiella maris]|uniref:Succinyl-diaminopimelate desuccinylase n=2 Tax=Aliikangiella maris TaxID=3162458 RepID=A0ABV2BTF2_9GAMM
MMKLTKKIRTFKKGQIESIDLPSARELTQATLSLSHALIEKPSITPLEAECLTLIENRLTKLSMNNQRMDKGEVSNLYSSFDNGKPVFCFVGHIDVVPPGDINNWHTDPFKPVEKEGYLYGRGSVDMKTAVAAMVVAIEQFEKLGLQKHIDIALVLTSDEEGDAIDGVNHVVAELEKKQQKVCWALVGEPSSDEQVGDTIKIGRRGSLTGYLTFIGKQGHVGYPEHIINPVKAASKIVYKFQNKQWDFPSRFFPASSFQVVKYQCDSGAENISPASVNICFNIRYSPKQTAQKLINYIEKKSAATGLTYEATWKIDAEPFITRRSLVREVVQQVVLQTQGFKPKLSTAGGTSDGRFFAKTGTQVVELGLCNHRIHQANERAPINDLGVLALMYLKILIQLNQQNA